VDGQRQLKTVFASRPHAGADAIDHLKMTAAPLRRRYWRCV